ncbi:MAPEG family protein [Stenotrophomonas terrae]|uniref:MAPEG family protein n=1 Tax=Stenotrophomonas terrae TaxID=405446 RepID=A0A0R0CMR3_9GAMM|nr:MAPEG family protein [Stenotrophomonas terrae]KRG66355.1 MAPEG family protein [Stenotrophomonas terrae]
MASPSLIALTLFVAWALVLMALMEVIRSKLVFQKTVLANEFRPDNANLSPFMQRLARAHANCIENIPVLGGLLLIAVVSGREHVTDPLAYVLVVARFVQTLIHLASSSSLAVTLRFVAFIVQVMIGLYWSFKLLTSI